MKLWQKILIAIFLGVVVGSIFGEHAKILKPLGDIFLNLIQMIVIPLVFFSIISGITSLNDPKVMGRIGGKAVFLYMITTLFAVTIGLLIGNALTPGAGIEIELSQQPAEYETISALDRIMDIIPRNPVASFAEGNVLQVIFFSVILGISIALVGKDAQPVVKMNDALTKVMFKMVNLIMKFAPYGVFGLMAWVSATQGPSVLLPLAKFVLVAFIAYIFHIVFIYGSVLGFFGGFSPITFFKKVFEVQLMAFTTSSSSATLPVTMRVTNENMGVSKGTSSFVLPLGTTVNMDGSAIYHGICVMFTAQAFGVDLSMNDYFTVMLTSLMVSIGAAGIPSGGFTMLTIVLTSVNLPIEAIAFIAAVERLLDMGRTVVNVTGDAAIAILIDKSEGKIDKKVFDTR